MRYLRIVIYAIVVCIQSAETNAADQEVNEVWQKLVSPSLSDQEKRKILEGLSEESRKQINEMDRADFKIRKKRAKDEMDRRIALLNKGTSPLLGLRSSYERRMKAIIRSVQSDELRRKIQVGFEEKSNALNRLIVANTPENNIALWRIYEPIMAKVTETSKYSETTPEQLAAMEANIINPLIAALEEDVAALPQPPPIPGIK